MKMDKKALGGAAGAAALVLFAGAQVFEMDSRIEALEAIHPELTTGIPMDPHDPEAPEAPEAPDGDGDKGKPEEGATEATEATEAAEAAEG